MFSDQVMARMVDTRLVGTWGMLVLLVATPFFALYGMMAVPITATEIVHIMSVAALVATGTIAYLGTIYHGQRTRLG